MKPDAQIRRMAAGALALGVACAAFAAPAARAAAHTSQTVSMASQALGREVRYAALLPDPLQDNARYPVVYLLHGAYGSYRDWPEKAPLAQAVSGRRLIVVAPDGGEFGWYVDSPIVPNHRYETFVTKELVADVDRRFPTVAERCGRAICGLSMGGHGALSLAAKRPDLYVSASSMSGILCLTNHPGKWRIAEALGAMPGARAEWEKHSVHALAPRFAAAGVALRFDTGTSDTTGAVEDNRLVHGLLEKHGVPHVYEEFPGGHTWAYWGSRLGAHLDFHGQRLCGGR